MVPRLVWPVCRESVRGSDRSFVGIGACPWAMPGLCYSSLQVVDVSDPTSPTRLGFVVTPGAPTDLAYRGGSVFATSAFGLLAIDCRNPMTPELVTSLELKGNWHSLALGDPLVYVASGPWAYDSISSALRIFDVRGPFRPRAVAHVENPDLADPLLRRVAYRVTTKRVTHSPQRARAPTPTPHRPAAHSGPLPAGVLEMGARGNPFC